MRKMNMEPANGNADYKQCNVQSAASAEELKFWWQRPILGSEYRPYRVKVVGKDQDTIRFHLVAHDGTESDPLEANFGDPDGYVWHGLPSTADRATDQKPYAFLMIAPGWPGFGTVDPEPYVQSGDKWPPGAGD